MSNDNNKKKRFEGLLQFREALRQSIVCLQASMGERFAHSIQSSLIRSLDEAPDNASYFHLLFGMGDKHIGDVAVQKDMRDHHILARIYQQKETDLKDELSWSALQKAQVSAWLDPSDAQATSYFFRIISMACNSLQPIDLNEASSWGSVLKSQSLKKANEAFTFLKSCQSQYSFSSERLAALEDYLERLLPLLRKSQSIHLLADGASIGLIVEGQSLTALPEGMQLFFDSLAPCRAHTLAINCSRAQTQFAMFTPIRMNHVNLGVPSLKATLVISEIKRGKKQKSKPLAS